MAGELDPRLIGLLKAALGFVDALRDIGVEGEIAVRLGRDGAQRLRDMVDPHGRSGISLAGLDFEWPDGEPLQAFAEYDNDGLGHDEETPAAT